MTFSAELNLAKPHLARQEGMRRSFYTYIYMCVCVCVCYTFFLTYLASFCASAHCLVLREREAMRWKTLLGPLTGQNIVHWPSAGPKLEGREQSQRQKEDNHVWWAKSTNVLRACVFLCCTLLLHTRKSHYIALMCSFISVRISSMHAHQPEQLYCSLCVPFSKIMHYRKSNCYACHVHLLHWCLHLLIHCVHIHYFVHRSMYIVYSYKQE